MRTDIEVLMTADAVGGVWTYAIDLARGLGRRGVSTTIAVLGPAPSREQRAAAEAITGLRLLETGLPLDWTADSRADIAAAGHALAALASETGCDILHLNSPALAAEARFPCPVVAVCHSCVATWWSAVRGGEPPQDFRWRTDLVGAGYRAADLLLAPSAAFARATGAAYELSDEPRVIHNGRADRPNASPTESAADPFVLTVGRLWDEGKNAALLDRIASRLPAPVLAAGPATGPNGASIELRHATALGHVDANRLDQLFAARPIFASLAFYEPFGLAVLEAAQAGCPLVLSDIPTFRELWTEAAVFVDPHDEAGATSALSDLLRGGSERERLGRAAQERAASYTLDRMADAMMHAYREVLAKAQRSSFQSAA